LTACLHAVDVAGGGELAAAADIGEHVAGCVVGDQHRAVVHAAIRHRSRWRRSESSAVALHVAIERRVGVGTTAPAR
jgi:hypothetical protein